MAWRHQTVSIRYDLSQHDFLFTLITPANGPLPPNPAPRHCPARGLSPTDLIGPIDLALGQPARQLSLAWNPPPVARVSATPAGARL